MLRSSAREAAIEDEDRQAEATEASDDGQQEAGDGAPGRGEPVQGEAVAGGAAVVVAEFVQQ